MIPTNPLKNPTISSPPLPHIFHSSHTHPFAAHLFTGHHFPQTYPVYCVIIIILLFSLPFSSNVSFCREFMAEYPFLAPTTLQSGLSAFLRDSSISKVSTSSKLTYHCSSTTPYPLFTIFTFQTNLVFTIVSCQPSHLLTHSPLSLHSYSLTIFLPALYTNISTSPVFTYTCDF